MDLRGLNLLHRRLETGHRIRARGGRCRGGCRGHRGIVVPGRRQGLLLGQCPTLGATFSATPQQSLRLPALAELGKKTVLQLELGIHILARRTGAGLHEALLEVVAEEGVQNGVHGRVRVAEAVEDQDEGQRSGEAQDEGVEYEGGVSVRVLGVGPLDVAGHVAVARLDSAGEEDDGQHQQHGGHPGEGRDQFGDKGRAVAGRGYWMAHSYIAIRRHDQQEDRGGERGDRGAHHVGLAHVVAEGPVAHLHGVQQKRYPNQEALIGDGQVQDVYVGHRLHLGETHHHIDDQCVAEQTDYAYQGIQDHRDELQDEVVAVRAVRPLIVVLQIVAAIVLRQPMLVVQVGPRVGRHYCSIQTAIHGSVYVVVVVRRHRWIRRGRFRFHGLQLLDSGSIWRYCQLLCGRY
ncbi:hypothetical protein M5D96_005379 [Drosophila gunungcola]|uniref:Uncharacterized protein n=1 Tax=Drosophila gunungcola TaxID=103775 RepID=A0A9P9YQC7_9MUSC|nr:hypothetical protein M5D96_005379 [Drosophila gunungcola]